jgi:hypothetical protein
MEMPVIEHPFANEKHDVIHCHCQWYQGQCHGSDNPIVSKQGKQYAWDETNGKDKIQ